MDVPNSTSMKQIAIRLQCFNRMDQKCATVIISSSCCCSNMSYGNKPNRLNIQTTNCERYVARHLLYQMDSFAQDLALVDQPHRESSPGAYPPVHSIQHQLFPSTLSPHAGLYMVHRAEMLLFVPLQNR